MKKIKILLALTLIFAMLPLAMLSCQNNDTNGGNENKEKIISVSVIITDDEGNELFDDDVVVKGVNLKVSHAISQACRDDEITIDFDSDTLEIKQIGKFKNFDTRIIEIEDKDGGGKAAEVKTKEVTFYWNHIINGIDAADEETELKSLHEDSIKEGDIIKLFYIELPEDKDDWTIGKDKK